MVNKRLQEVSSNKNEYERDKGIYDSALKSSGYTQSLSYRKENNTNQSKQRKRKLIWFNPPFNKSRPKCNCRNKTNCPHGDCKEKCLVHKVGVTTENHSHVHYGQYEGDFKTRHNNHTKSFRHRKYENEIKLSKHVRVLKDCNQRVQKKLVHGYQGSPYKSGSGRCALCLIEKDKS